MNLVVVVVVAHLAEALGASTSEAGFASQRACCLDVLTGFGSESHDCFSLPLPVPVIRGNRPGDKGGEATS